MYEAIALVATYIGKLQFRIHFSLNLSKIYLNNQMKCHYLAQYRYDCHLLVELYQDMPLHYCK